MSNSTNKHRFPFLWSSLSDFAFDRFVPEQIRDGDIEARQRARIVVVFGWSIAFLGTPFALLYYLAGSNISSLAVLGGVATVPGIFEMLRRTASTWLTGNIECLVLYAVLTTVGIVMGGDIGPSILWYTAIPLLATATAGKQSGWGWLVIILVSLVAFAGAELAGFGFRNDLSSVQHRWLGLVSLVGVIVLIQVLISVFETFKTQTIEQIRESEEFERVLSDASPDFILIWMKAERSRR